jgi:hypothetical protein
LERQRRSYQFEPVSSSKFDGSEQYIYGHISQNNLSLLSAGCGEDLVPAYVMASAAISPTINSSSTTRTRWRRDLGADFFA